MEDNLPDDRNYYATNELFSGFPSSVPLSSATYYTKVPIPNWWGNVANLDATAMGQLVEPYLLSHFGRSQSHRRANAPVDGYADDGANYLGNAEHINRFRNNRRNGYYGLHHRGTAGSSRGNHRRYRFGSPVEVKYTGTNTVYLSASQWSILNQMGGYLIVGRLGVSVDEGYGLYATLFHLSAGRIQPINPFETRSSIVEGVESWIPTANVTFEVDPNTMNIDWE